MTKDLISLSISVLLLFRHYISHKITFGAPSSGGVLRSACGAFIFSSKLSFQKSLQEHYQSVEQFGFRSGPNFYRWLSVDDKSCC